MTRTAGLSTLRVAQAHRPLFYLPHLVADAIGAFGRRSLALEVVPMATSEQWTVLSTGMADLALGGPMRTMRLMEDGHRLVTFSAAVATSPWVLAGHPSIAPISDPRELSGDAVLDDIEIATARLCLRGLLHQTGVDASALQLEITQRSDLVARLRDAAGPLALAPYEAIAGLVDRGLTHVVANLCEWIGRVPWSAYQVLPDVLDERRAEFVNFTDAVGEALRFIAREPIPLTARLVGARFPHIDAATLETVLGVYRRMGVWATTPAIARDDFERFGSLLLSAGWLHAMPSYDALVASPVELT